MKQLETEKENIPHEICVIIEVISKDFELAKSIVQFSKHRFFYAQYPEQVNSSGGGAALIVDEPLFPKNMAYKWTMDHLLKLDDACDPKVFRMEFLIFGE